MSLAVAHGANAGEGRPRSPAFIEACAVTKSFAADEGIVQALASVSLDVGEREFVSIIGPSGCGKSTLLRLIADLVPFDEGKICVAGDSPEGARRKRIYSFVFQDTAMLPWRSVLENVALPLELAGVPTARRRELAAALLEQVGLAGFEQRRPDQLSGGMRQRAALARALATEPRLLLMDEPFGALDEITRAQMNLVMRELLHARPLAVLMVTHSIEEAVFLSDRVIVMSPRPGRIRVEIPIELPAERLSAIRNTSSFFEHVARIRTALDFEPIGGIA